MTTQQLIAASCLYSVALVAVIYFTRATARRVVGALIGGLAVAVVGFGIESLAHALGWWRYPGVETPYGPPLMYPLLVLAWAIFALLGWRITRRFGLRGEAVYLVTVGVLGTLRDYLIAGRLLKVVVFTPGIGMVLLDVALWIGLVALAQAAMYPVAGPVRNDPLAMRNRPTE